MQSILCCCSFAYTYRRDRCLVVHLKAILVCFLPQKKNNSSTDIRRSLLLLHFIKTETMCFETPWLYKNLLFFQGSIGFCEFVLMLVRIGYFFSPGNRSNLLIAGFIIDWIASLGPTLVGLFVTIVLLVLVFRLCVIALNCYLEANGRTRAVEASGLLTRIVGNKAIRRFIILDCNCPCYQPRPKRRFQVRLGYLILCFILRIIAIALYASARFTDQSGEALAILVTISLAFIFITLCLDFYRYIIWWHYTPTGDHFCRSRSEKHERFIPYHLIGNRREPSSLGNKPCSADPCLKTELDHIVIFHSNEFQPQRRWSEVGDSQPLFIDTSKWPFAICKKKEPQPHYIGFHTTTPEATILIAHGNFRNSVSGWLGAGVYFARSVDGTLGKHRSAGGAWIIVEVRMGKVYEVSRNKIDPKHPMYDPNVYEYVTKSKWKQDYDTCYMLHDDERRDEFAIKDPHKQIVKWVMVIDEQFDRKVKLYGLDEEFQSTRCYCI